MAAAVALAAVLFVGGGLFLAGHDGWIPDKPVTVESRAYFACQQWVKPHLHAARAERRWPRSDSNDVAYYYRSEEIDVVAPVWDGTAHRLFECRVEPGITRPWTLLELKDLGRA